MGRTQPLLLGIDLGTTNVKALVAEYEGKILSQASATVPIKFGHDGGVRSPARRQK
jgi:sugar (pentulose or hexulose) kinase